MNRTQPPSSRPSASPVSRRPGWLWPVVVAGVALFFSGLIYWQTHPGEPSRLQPEASRQRPPSWAANPPRPELIAVAVRDVTVEAEYSASPEDRRMGLMHRPELAVDAGMWFEFDQQQPLTFWMRNTHVPLSIAFVDQAGVITNIADMVPFDLTSIPSSRPARYALEMNRGWFAQQGIQPGDQITIGPRRPNPAAEGFPPAQ